MRTESAQRRSVLRPVPAEVQHRQQEAVRSHAHVQLQLEQEAQNRPAHKQVLEARESFPPVRTPASSWVPMLVTVSDLNRFLTTKNILDGFNIVCFLLAY